ncbi:MAG: ABC transporter permease [Gammaproteobacteria bacterium]|nr:ABC transporter permease [Gammaproteobacteria bacterium]
MPTNKTSTIAYYTFREATQNRLFVLTLIGLVCLLGAAEFVGDLAITETRQFQISLLATIGRWFLVITVALFVITSMIREFNDKGSELILSLPVSKSTYYFGKFLGYFILGVVIAISLSVLMLLYADTIPLAIWLVSLICEAAIVMALSMLCLFTFSNITIAFISTLSFYILSRSIDAIQLISISPILETKTISQDFMASLVSLIAFVLPDLSRFTQTEWLVYGVNVNEMGYILVQTAIYLTLLITAGLFDLARKEF